jgi:hypothetical protein
MPKTATAKARSGANARGAARINQQDELPNTASEDWREKFQGSTSTAAVLGDDSENASPNPSYAMVAAKMKRPLAARAGVGHGRGKTPRTILRRITDAAAVLEAELLRRARYYELESVCKEALANAEQVIVRELLYHA